MIGETLAHYRILQELGAGGMGKVYLAEDTTLDRRVALKVLPPELARSAERLERFEREARTLAALDHPNIVTIHSVEEAEGVRFLTMAHVQGKTLGESIPPGGLELDSLLELAVAFAEGLRAAHERGIVHRDLKPANVMVDTDGRLRILDFGLAKLQPKPVSVVSGQAPTETLGPEMTREGSVLGTFPYMSPEQVEGRSVDARSDLFSFGVILYEMATGERPFSGESPASLISSILRDRPKPLATTRPRLPARLGEIVERCLAKDPAKRFQTAADLRDALAELSRQVAAGEARPTPSGLLRATRWGIATLGAIVLLVVLLAGAAGLWRAERPPPAAEETRIASLAVLPLRNGSGDPEQAYLVDGITEALITDLSKIGALRVISRSSAMRYRNTEKPIGAIAAELGVDALVEGSVTREGDRVGIMVQLREAHGERALWGERYVRDLTSVLALQGEIARTVAAEIEVSLTPEEETRLATVREVDPEAYEAYARGMHYLREVTPEGVEKGLASLHEAVEKDPSDPLPWAGLALAYSLAAHGPSPPTDAFAQAKSAALEALALDGTVAQAHAALAQIRLYQDWDWEGAERAFERALALNSSLADTRAHYSWYLFLFGHTERALEEMRRAEETDPLAPLWSSWLGWQLWWAERFPEAVGEAERSLRLDPDFSPALWVLGAAYASQGMHDRAIETHERLARTDPLWRFAPGVSYALAGRHEEALEVIAGIEGSPEVWDTFFLAQVHAVLGNEDQAFQWLESAYEGHHPYIPWARNQILLAPLYDDPRFLDLLRRMDLPGPSSS